MSLNINPSRGDAELPLHRAERLVDDVSGLVSPPDVCLRLMEVIHAPQSSATDIGRVMATDPNTTARLLRIVNSSFYGFTRRIDTVSRAVAVIGTRDLYNLVLAVSAVNTFTHFADGAIDLEVFWRHSIFCAVLARRLARLCGVLHPERLFVIGLLHDIGRLVICHRLPEVARQTLLEADGDEARLWESECEILGFSHATLGAMLFRLWQLPEPLEEAVLYHHDPEAAPATSRAAAIAYLADLLANRSELGAFCLDPLPLTVASPVIWEMLGLREEAVDEAELLTLAGVEYSETTRALLPG